MRIPALRRFCFILMLALSLTVLAPVNVIGASASIVPQNLSDKAQRQGAVRVIVRLGAISPPENWVESDIELANRRAYIAFAQISIRSNLSAVAHQVIREYQDFPYM